MNNASINKDILFANRLLRTMMENWITNPDKTFISVYNSFVAQNFNEKFHGKAEKYNMSHGDYYRAFLKGMILLNVTTVTTQVFSYAYENVFKNYNQFSQSEKNKLSNLKASFLQGQNLNNDQILKLIRQAIAHNNDLVADPNFMFNIYDEKFTFHLKDNLSRITVTNEELLKLISLYLNNVEDLAYEDYSLEVYLNKLKQKNILHLRKKSENKLINPDREQLKALEFLSDEVKSGRLGQDSRIMLQYPFKSGALVNLINCLDFQSILHNLLDKRMLTFNEFAQLLEKNKNKSLNKFEQFIVIGDILSAFDTNALFQIFSTSKLDGMQEALDKVKTGLDVNKIRNSIIHSTYFYNRDNHIVFYDGKKKQEEELKFVGTLSLQEVGAFAFNFLEYKFPVGEQENEK